MLHLFRAVLRWIDEHVRGLFAEVGAYLLLGFGFSVAALALFSSLAALVSEGVTQRVDDVILLWLHARATPILDDWALEITALGGSVVVVTVVMVASAFLWVLHQRWSVGLLWAAMLGGAVLNLSLKFAFARPRPELWERIDVGSASFPSGHAMSAISVYGTLAYLVMRLQPTPFLRRLTLAVALLLIVSIGLTRMYLGVHYPSDVLAGYAAALSWAGFCALGVEAIRYFRAGGDARGE